MTTTQNVHDKCTDSDAPITRRVFRPDVAAAHRRAEEERAQEFSRLPCGSASSSGGGVAARSLHAPDWRRGAGELRAVGASSRSHASLGMSRGDFSALVGDVAAWSPADAAAPRSAPEAVEPEAVAAVAAAFAAGARHTAQAGMLVEPPPLPADVLETAGTSPFGADAGPGDMEDPNLRSLRRAAAELRRTRSRPPTAPSLAIADEESTEEVALARLAASASAPSEPVIALDPDELAALIAEVVTGG